MNSPNSMRRLAVYTPKGGIGKTTTTHSVASQLAAEGERVLLIDLDHQANLTYWLGVEDGPTLFDVIRGDVSFPAAIRSTAVPGVDVVAASAYLIGAEPTLRARPGAELWLRRQIGRLPKRWDWIIFDCGPGFGLLTIAALATVDQILAPVEPHTLSLAGVGRLLESIDDVRFSLNEDLKLLAVVPVKVDRRLVLAREALGELAEVLGDRLARAEIRTNIRLAEAPSHHLPIFEYAPNSTGAKDYRALTKEIQERWPTAG